MIIYNSEWSIIIQWIRVKIVRWQSDLENTKESIQKRTEREEIKVLRNFTFEMKIPTYYQIQQTSREQGVVGVVEGDTEDVAVMFPLHGVWLPDIWQGFLYIPHKDPSIIPTWDQYSVMVTYI